MTPLLSNLAGNCVIPRVLLEFEVIREDGSMYVDTERGQFLFTKARANLILASHPDSKLWKMPHTPYSHPGEFCPMQRDYFLARRCSRIVSERGALRLRLCGQPAAARRDRGYCLQHPG